MRIRIAVPEEHVHPNVVDAALESVTRLNEHMIRAGQTPTSHELVKQGAIWRPENMGDEHFDHGGTIAARGWGDCDDWAPLHAATLRASGEDPGATARVIPSGPSTYHAIVQRSDGSIDDPSIAAGMHANRVGGPDPEHIQLWACDPHDGRIYQGQLAPTVGPLSIHCGPGVAVRGATVVGMGTLYEGRCDLPLDGSPLVPVRSYMRHRARHRGVRGVVGQLPYALSCTAHGSTPQAALMHAITGAILCGDAAELATSLDRYKLMAVQAAMAGMSPGQVREALVAQMTNDLQQHAAATGTHPSEHTQRMLTELAVQGVVCGPIVVGDFFSDIGHLASGVVSAVSDVANTVAKAVSSVPWGDIIHDVQAAVSVIPGIGTAVSDVIAAAESAYDAAAAALSGDPLGGAIHAAYNFALGTVPGAAALHPILDPVVNTLLNIALHKEPVESAVLNGILDAVPDAPKFGPISPRSVVASLAHMLIGHLGVKASPGAPVPPKPALAPPPAVHLLPAVARAVVPPPRVVPIHLARPPVKRPPPKPVAKPLPKPPGVPHAALHVSLAHAATPPLPPRAAMPRPGSPGAPPGASHWMCSPGPGGTWACRWA
jgi:hypothetical protein